ncbi:MAG: radical SAM protein [bacterium]|nr:radical SAM protein [bacterium]
MGRAIQFVYPQDTQVVSLSDGSCALGCDHCNKHYIEQMPTLRDQVKPNTTSYLISGGLKPDGKSFVLDKKKEIEAIKKKGNYRFNSHVGFVAPEELDAMAELVDYVSFDFVSDAAVIKRVYHLDKTVDQYIAQFKLLRQKIEVYPHVTIGLDAGRIHWEYEAIDILNSLGADRLVLNVLIPTPGTKFEKVPNPDLSEVTKVFRHARKTFSGDRLLILGCMRPSGAYRGELDLMAVQEGVDRIVQPTPPARKYAEEQGFDISYFYECCALDAADNSRQTNEYQSPKEAVESGCCNTKPQTEVDSPFAVVD